MSTILQTDVKFVPGVGPKRAALLNKEIDVYTIGDLLRWYPYRYIDRSRLYYIHEIDGSMPYIQLKGRITAFETFGEGRKGDWLLILPMERDLSIWCGFRESDTSKTGISSIPNILFSAGLRFSIIGGT